VTEPPRAKRHAGGDSRTQRRAELEAVATDLPSRATHVVGPAHRVWLQEDGVLIFGRGVQKLLWRVAETGSLHQAAADLGMSYSKAWSSVRETEQRLGIPLLERQAGGTRGGGSALTPEAQDLLERFDALTRDAYVALNELYRKHFADAPFDIADAHPEHDRPGT